MDFSEAQMYFDTDDDPSTGYQVEDFPMGSGAEFNFYGEGLNVYTEVNEHQGEPKMMIGKTFFIMTSTMMEPAADGGPAYSSVVDLTGGNKAIEISMPRGLLGGVSNVISFAIYDNGSSSTIPASGDPSSKFIRAEF